MRLPRTMYFFSQWEENMLEATAGNKLKKILKGELSLLIILIIISIILGFMSSYFFRVSNILNIVRQVSIDLIVAVGMTCVILTGEIDLSVGSIAALGGVITAYILEFTGNGVFAITCGIISGIIIGFINGYLVVKMRIQSFIVTLAMMSIARGIALVLTNGYPVSNLPESFGIVGSGYIGIVPVITILSLLIFLVFYYWLRFTKHGLHIKAIGANKTAARLSAINVDFYKILVFVLSGALAAVGGILIVSRLLSGQPTAATEMNMDVISAVILGGTSLSGGQGSVVGTLIGAFILGVINNGLNLLNVSSFYQQIVKGLIILIAVLSKSKENSDG